MTAQPTADRPTGVYLVALYLVVTGFLESIQKYRELEGPVSLSPLAEHSVWALAADTVVFLVFAYLVWNFVWLGRLAALVWCYAMIAMYIGITILYLFDVPLNNAPLVPIVGAYHVLASIPIVAYLQPARQKKVFRVSIMELLLSND